MLPKFRMLIYKGNGSHTLRAPLHTSFGLDFYEFVTSEGFFFFFLII